VAQAPSPPSASGSKPSVLGPFRPSVLHVCYRVADIDRSLAFYVDLLGMQEQMRLSVGRGIHEVVLRFPDTKGSGLVLIWSDRRTEPYAQGNAYARLIVRVSDVDAATRALAERGTPVVNEPADAGALRYSMVSDPDGYVVELLQLERT
jgi:lactoylglutathione lyase